MQIRPDERVLTGRWGMQGDRVIADETTERIRRLTESYLVKLGHDSSGWHTLFKDPTDGRLWELTYPQGHMHGGGPPQLQLTDEQEAAAKYGPQPPA